MRLPWTAPSDEGDPLVFRVAPVRAPGRAPGCEPGRASSRSGAADTAVYPLPLPANPPGARRLRLRLQIALEPAQAERLSIEIADPRQRRRSLARPERGLSVTEVGSLHPPAALALHWHGDGAPPELPQALVVLAPSGRAMPDGAMGLPDFLGLGAMRTGSTYLHSLLRRHPGAFVPPFKELHFLDEYYHRSDPSMGHPWAPARARARRRMDALQQDGDSTWSEWFRRYLEPGEGCRDWLWYASLFQANRSDRLIGEITPSYALLPAEGVAQLAARLPGLKAFYTLRDPVERAWSQFLLRCRHDGRSPESVAEAEMRAFLESDSNLRRGRYRATIEIWEAALRPGHLHLQLFDGLRAAPEDAVGRLFAFLGLESSAEGVTDAETTRKHGLGRSRRTPPPSSVAARLREIYASEIAWLAARFGGRVAHWGRPWD